MAEVNPKIIATRLRQLQGIEQLAFPSDRPKYYFDLLISEYNRQSLLAAGTLNPIANICLPLPIPLIHNHQIAYSEQPIGTLLGGAVNALQNMYGVTRPDTQSFNAMVNSKAVGGMLGRTPVGPIIQSAGSVLDAAQKFFLGLAPNQFLTVLLNGPTYRRFTYQWRFSPNTPAESETLRRIVQVLNNAISPGLSAFGAFWTFPKIFYLAFTPNVKYMYKHKPCVVENFQVNYTPGGNPSFYRATPETGGLNAPEGMDISMSFIELELWVEQDFNDTNYPFDSTRTTATTGPGDSR